MRNLFYCGARYQKPVAWRPRSTFSFYHRVGRVLIFPSVVGIGTPPTPQLQTSVPPLTFFGSNFRAQKSLDFQVPPLPVPLVMMLHPSKPLRTVPYKQQVY